MSKTRILIQALGKALEKVPEKIGTLPSEEELIKQGFDPKTFYHGGPVPDIQEFVPQSRNRTAFAERSTNKGAPATFFSESEGYVETFAKQGGRPFFDENLGMMNYEPSPSARIYPVKLKLTVSSSSLTSLKLRIPLTFSKLYSGKFACSGALHIGLHPRNLYGSPAFLHTSPLGIPLPCS